jgi:hypothetical protein
MLSRADKWFLAYLAAGYIAFAEVLSWETSRWPACIVVSQYQGTNNQPGYQTCATLHEGIMRFLAFSWGYVTHDNVSAAAAVVIAIFTWTLWRSTRLLWLSGERHSERQLRAYVMVDSVHLLNLAIGGHPEAVITIKNSGQTPATNLTHWAAMGFSTFPLTGPLPRRDRMLPPRPLAPDATFIVNTGINQALNVATIVGIQRGSHALYVIGEIRYTDAFGKSRETDYLLFCTRDMIDREAMASYDTGNRIT